ncbi:MAG: DUF4177 domain-containing protein [Armatimonadota bacterium]|nr:DUF4177 domain-containing protein [Armatimonadota bacterium]
MAFEYKVLLVEPSWSAAAGRENIENELNELGKEGWELIPITLDGYLLLQRAKSDAKG